MRIRLLQMSESLILHQKAKVYFVEVNSFEVGGSFKHSYFKIIFCFSMTMGSLTFYFSGLRRDFGSIGE